ncbi:MAG TPA: flagellar hook-basal body complex protein FliE [Solirubrobacteraceae bacterium]|jgi:flagellar hook-basal body complex protein FliE|nr:flagellar hook-basal body complex protein FliE [Solirubrobacteraceae bacterium]
MIPPVGGIGGGFHVAPLTPSSPAEAGGPEAAGAAGGEGSFAGALGKAVSSLEASQNAAQSAATGVATGTTSNPEAAVVTVENAQLEMQLASQMRAKATEALQNIFQTQI